MLQLAKETVESKIWGGGGGGGGPTIFKYIKVYPGSKSEKILHFNIL